MRRLLTTLLVAILWVFAPLNALADVNINTATSSQLETLPGIGPAKASAIIQYRTDHGPFTTVAQLDNVPGIGPATMANLSGMVSIGDSVGAFSRCEDLDKVDGIGPATVSALMDTCTVGEPATAFSGTR